MLDVINEFPPNYEAIKDRFPDLENYKPIFSYGGKIYNPFDKEVTPDLQVHEGVHKLQQEKDKDWWDQYLENDAFRLTQEVEAYAAQYAFIKTIVNSKGANWYLDRFADVLSSSLYGKMLNFHEAHAFLRHAAKNVKP